MRYTSSETTDLPEGLWHSQFDAIEEKEQSDSIGKRRVGRGTTGKRRLTRNLGAIESSILVKVVKI